MIKKKVNKLDLVDEPEVFTTEKDISCVSGGETMYNVASLRILLNSKYGAFSNPATEFKTWGNLNDEYEIEYR